MTRRKTILLAAIAALAAVYAAELALQSRNAVRELTMKDAPDAITVARGGVETLTLAKDGDRWVVGERKYPADKAQVDAMLKAIGELKSLGAVSGSGDWARYGLDEPSAVTVTARKGGKVIRTLACGKNSSTSQQSYARLDGAKDVILVAGRLRDQLDRGADALRDRTVWNLKSEGITRVDSDFSGAGNELSANGSRRAAFAVAKAGDPAAWQGVPLAGQPAPKVDGAKTATWADGLAALRADSFAPDGTAVPDKTLGTLKVVAAGKTVTLTVARKEGDTKYLCVSSEIPYPFYLQKGTVIKLAKTPEEF